jgi:excisionase family DNA binding protein
MSYQFDFDVKNVEACQEAIGHLFWIISQEHGQIKTRRLFAPHGRPIKPRDMSQQKNLALAIRYYLTPEDQRTEIRVAQQLVKENETLPKHQQWGGKKSCDDEFAMQRQINRVLKQYSNQARLLVAIRERFGHEVFSLVIGDHDLSINLAFSLLATPFRHLSEKKSRQTNFRSVVDACIYAHQSPSSNREIEPMNARKPIDVPLHKRLTASIREAKEATGLGESTIYGLIREGTLETVKVGKSRLIKVPSLLRLVESAVPATT